jgi:C4-dicarboxylate-specific signal transduction histidine kinase
VEKLDITVLFVEDEDVLRAIYERILDKYVARLFVAENGKEGLSLFREHKPDLIITDIQMPVMDGLEMIEHIRQEDRKVRLVILSAYGEAEYFMDAIKIGVNSFLIKPVETKKLTTLIQELSEGILLERELRDQELKRLKAEDNLRKLNEELERRIEERTIDLQKEIKEKIQAEKQLKELLLNLEKRVKDELKKRQKQQQLLIQKSKLESIGELAAGMAHEINQPLGSISMGLDNILFKYSNDSESREYVVNKLNSLFEDIERIRQIINHVRVFSRDQQLAMQDKVELNHIVNSALSMVKAQYQSHNVEVELDLEDQDCLTQGNKFRIEQVLLNLLSNAKHAVDKRAGSLQEDSFKKRIKVSSYIENLHVGFIVKDNGVGISKGDMDNIFDPFFTTKDVEEGTGLGLSISYGIVKEMKGEITIESKLNSYTEVKVVFPRFDE